MNNTLISNQCHCPKNNNSTTCYQSNPSNCKKYTICDSSTGNIISEQTCHFGTYFNEINGLCEYPYKIKNSKERNCTEINQPNNICDLVSPGYYADEKDCSKYYHCMGSSDVSQVYTCAIGTLWNPVKFRCSLMENMPLESLKCAFHPLEFR